jgi:hypothetical protein
VWCHWNLHQRLWVNAISLHQKVSSCLKLYLLFWRVIRYLEWNSANSLDFSDKARIVSLNANKSSDERRKGGIRPGYWSIGEEFNGTRLINLALMWIVPYVLWDFTSVKSSSI